MKKLSKEEKAKEFLKSLQERLEGNNNKPYSELLRSPHWQKKRLKILERDDWQCKMCYDKESPLNVHHKYYLKGATPWDYDDDALITLCDGCHESYHNNKDEFIEDIDVEIEKMEKYLIRKNKELREKYIKPLEDLK